MNIKNCALKTFPEVADSFKRGDQSFVIFIQDVNIMFSHLYIYALPLPVKRTTMEKTGRRY